VYVESGSCSHIGVGDLLGYRSVDVDVEASTHSKIPGKKSGGALDDPAIVDQIKSFEKAVISDLALQLLKRPWRRLS
jgi:hypothetical protein